MAILYGFAVRFLFGVVFLHKAKEGRRLCAVSTQNLFPHQRTAHWFTMKARNPFRPSESHISSPRHGGKQHVGKQHRTNNEPQNRIKWPWIEPTGYTEKATTGPALRKYNSFLYSCLNFYVFFVKLTTVLWRFNNCIEFESEEWSSQ